MELIYQDTTYGKYCNYPLCCGSGWAWIHTDLGIWLSRIRNRIFIEKADPDKDLNGWVIGPGLFLVWV
jgi:hypothetical protein